jgi:hypothetical protein
VRFNWVYGGNMIGPDLGPYFKIPPHTLGPPPRDSDGFTPLASTRNHPPIGTAGKPPTHRRTEKPPTHPPTGTNGKSVDPDSSAKHERGEIDGAPPTGAPRTDPSVVAVRFFGLTHRHR